MRSYKILAVPLLVALLLVSNNKIFSQVHTSSAYTYLLDEKSTMRHIKYLASPEILGRAAGTSQAKEVADYISKKFSAYGLRPFNSINYFQQFVIPSERQNEKVSSKSAAGSTAPVEKKDMTGYNVVGYVPSKNKDANYIVIGAHYDHIGSHGEKYYPGADDNASGVAAMLEIAKAFGMRYKEMNDLKHHIVFVAFDANNHNLHGSKMFMEKKGIPPEKISFMINLDQIGSVFAPVDDNKEYIVVLGADKLKQWEKEQLEFANEYFQLGLYIDYTYYGSGKFYDIFYRLSDQQSFTEKGVPALLFTSGITRFTNKETDDVDKISPSVLQRRIELIYRFLWLID